MYIKPDLFVYRVRGSCGFEHVFVGEVQPYLGKVLGFHNWIQLYMEEKNKNLNYMGYLKKAPVINFFLYSS